MRYLFPIFFLLFVSSLVHSQQRDLQLFPKESIRFKILMDPVESQNSVTFSHLSLNDTIKESLYIPTAIGFYKPLIGWKGDIKSEIGIDVVALSQFGVIKVEDDPHYSADYQLNLLNIDYKLSLLYTVRKDRTSYRFRLFHLSSHLGDDYLLRYGFDRNGYWFKNPRNYEQIDFFIFHKNHHFNYFFGTGCVISPDPARERLSFQGGLELYYPISKMNSVYSSMFITSMQETSFSPSAKMSLGIDIKKDLKILIEYYEGNLPYSAFETIHIGYFGVGLYLSDL
jgi:Protein of unknown function (DUF1207)